MIISVLAGPVLAADAIPWAAMDGVERTAHGYRTTVGNARLIVPALAPALSDKHSYLLLEISTPQPTSMQILWMKTAGGGLRATNLPLAVPSHGTFVTRVVDLAGCGPLDATDQIWIMPGSTAGLEFDIRRIALVTRKEVPADLLPDLIEFTCLTGKLHYQPGCSEP